MHATSIRLPIDLLERIDKIADETHRTRSNVIRLLLERQLAKEPNGI